MNAKPCSPVPRLVLCAAVFAAAAGCAQKQPPPQAIAPPSAAAAPAPAPVEAADILQRMAARLAGSPRFSVNLRCDYDVLQPSGQKIEFGEARKILVNRPNQLRVEAEHSDGEKHLVLYDGRQLTAFTPSQNVYAQAMKTGDIDEAVVYFVKELGMRLPFAMLLLSKLPGQIELRTQALDYVEGTVVDGTPAHHLAGRTETVDYQVWIAAGPEPLLLRAVLTYKNAEGQPQFRARFSDWNFSPAAKDADFAFTPPAGAQRISFLAQLPKIGLPGAATPEQTGGQQ